VVVGSSVLSIPKAKAVVAEPVAVPAVGGFTSPAVWRRYERRPWARQYSPYRGYSGQFRFVPRWHPREWNGGTGYGPRYGSGWNGRRDRRSHAPYYNQRSYGWGPDWRYVPRGEWSYGRQIGGYDWRTR
jgi:hypothetical protein